MSLITPDQLKEHINSTKTDAALQQIIDAEERDIVDRYGPNDSQVEEIERSPTSAIIFTKRAISSITEIVETVTSEDAFFDSFAESSTTLAADDYEITPDAKRVRRKDDGTNPRTRWGERVKITYVPAEGTAKRVMVLINLCKLNLAYTGPKSERIGGGEYQSDIGSYQQQRLEILSELDSSIRSYA